MFLEVAMERDNRGLGLLISKVASQVAPVKHHLLLRCCPPHLRSCPRPHHGHLCYSCSHLLFHPFHRCLFARCHGSRRPSYSHC